MKLSDEEVLHIARLARLGLTKADVELFGEQLSHILDNFQALQQVDTTDVPPTAQPNQLQNVLKPDEALPSLSPDAILANAPCREQGFFRIRAVLE